MNDVHLSIAELADAAGVSRRAVRFYVSRKLLSPPEGRGRGGHYTAAHVAQLRRIQELQRVGHPLDAIHRILAGQPVDPPPEPSRPVRAPNIQASLWTRIVLAPGVELHIDTARHRPSAEALLAAREAVRSILEAGGQALDAGGEISGDKPQRRIP
jgi:DNA-binding transcriptional MerR regulator